MEEGLRLFELLYGEEPKMMHWVLMTKILVVVIMSVMTTTMMVVTYA